MGKRCCGAGSARRAAGHPPGARPPPRGCWCVRQRAVLRRAQPAQGHHAAGGAVPRPAASGRRGERRGGGFSAGRAAGRSVAGTAVRHCCKRSAGRRAGRRGSGRARTKRGGPGPGHGTGVQFVKCGKCGNGKAEGQRPSAFGCIYARLRRVDAGSHRPETKIFAHGLVRHTCRPKSWPAFRRVGVRKHRP